MKEYRVSPELKPYIRAILVRSFYSCSMTKGSDGTWSCQTNASSDTFHRIVQRAKCEKKTKETGVFQVTAEEAMNPMRLSSLLTMAKETSFEVIDDPDGKRVHKNN